MADPHNNSALLPMLSASVSQRRLRRETSQPVDPMAMASSLAPCGWGRMPLCSPRTEGLSAWGSFPRPTWKVYTLRKSSSRWCHSANRTVSFLPVAGLLLSSEGARGGQQHCPDVWRDGSNHNSAVPGESLQQALLFTRCHPISFPSAWAGACRVSAGGICC